MRSVLAVSACSVALTLAACAEKRTPDATPSPPASTAVVAGTPPASASSRSSAIADPLFPSRPAQKSISPLPKPATSARWPKPRPPRELAYSRSAKERNGYLPCEAPEPGSAVHGEWVHVRPMGQYVAPRTGALAADGSFDLVVHFHGHRPALKELGRSGEDLVLLGVSLGIGKAYGPPFADAAALETLVANVERSLGKQHGKTAHARRIALSSWSRGYEAIAEILRQPIAKRVVGVILLDSLHASRDPRRGPQQLAPFEAFARRAAEREVFMVVTHSSIDTDRYASSTESAHFLVDALRGEPIPAVRRDPLGLELVDFFSRGQFHERGYAGNGKLDHCAHFGVYPAALRALVTFFRSQHR